VAVPVHVASTEHFYGLLDDAFLVGPGLELCGGDGFIKIEHF